MQTYFSQEARYINTELLNVRIGPGKNYEVLDTAPKGEKVTVLSASGNWTQIQMDSGIKGFVSSKFLVTDAPISKRTKKDSSIWWKAILGTIGFLFLVKIFGGKTQPSSNEKSKSTNYVLKKTNFKPKITEQKLGIIYLCKYCGTERQNLSNLTRESCRSSPNGHHQPFEGLPRNKYFCKFCGTERRTLSNLTRESCKSSSSGKHQAYEGEELQKYSCKYCGTERRSLANLTRESCRSSPNGYHQPLI